MMTTYFKNKTGKRASLFEEDAYGDMEVTYLFNGKNIDQFSGELILPSDILLDLNTSPDFCARFLFAQGEDWDYYKCEFLLEVTYNGRNWQAYAWAYDDSPEQDSVDLGSISLEEGQPLVYTISLVSDQSNSHIYTELQSGKNVSREDYNYSISIKNSTSGYITPLETTVYKKYVSKIPENTKLATLENIKVTLDSEDIALKDFLIRNKTPDHPTYSHINLEKETLLVHSRQS